jgi:hypothetical protein
MYYSYVEIEYVATSFSPARTDLAVKQLMTSEEIITQSCLYGILYISFCLPMQWLAAETPELREWGWGPTSSSDAIDTLREKMMDIINDPTKVLDEGFMMNMFSKYIDALPPFQEYWKHSFEKKRIRVIAAESGAMVLQFDDLRKELFHTSHVTNAATDEHLVELAKVAAAGILDELHDEKKATWKYLSVLGSPLSYQGCPADVKENLKGREATNDRSEGALGQTTHQLQKYGHIDLTNAAAVSDAKTNGYFLWLSRNSNTTKRNVSPV